MPWTSLAVEVAAIVLAATILGVVGWLTRSIRDLRRELAAADAANDRRLDYVEKQVIKIEDLDRHNVIERVGRLEVELAKAVKSAELTRVHERVDALSAEVHSMAGKVESVDRSLETIYNYLLKSTGGAAA